MCTTVCSYSFSYHESNLKQSSMPALGEPSKSNPFLSGGMLYPCASNRDSLQQQLANDNRLLWATLTPHGTRHFVSEFPAQESHYEVVDYKAKPQTAKPLGRDTLKRVPVKVDTYYAFISIQDLKPIKRPFKREFFF